MTQIRAYICMYRNVRVSLTFYIDGRLKFIIDKHVCNVKECKFTELFIAQI